MQERDERHGSPAAGQHRGQDEMDELAGVEDTGEQHTDRDQHREAADGEAGTPGQQDPRMQEQRVVVANSSATAQDARREELAHDLRNALAGLRAALHTLSVYDGQLDELTARQLRDAAAGEVEHLAHLVDGADHDDVVDFEVATVVRDVVRTQRATGQRVRLAGTAGVVRGRPGDLATVLQNLLVNARAHAPGSAVTVQLSGSGRQVEIAVADRGPGLSEADAGRAFGRGERGVSSDGSGLGLYVSRSLMRKHGGDVELRGRVGGATFVVTLPAVERRGAAVSA